MNPTFQKAIADASTDIMRYVEALNGCTCEKFRATHELITTGLSTNAFDTETRSHLIRLLGMMSVVHFAKHNLQRIAECKTPQELATIITRELSRFLADTIGSCK